MRAGIAAGRLSCEKRPDWTALIYAGLFAGRWAQGRLSLDMALDGAGKPGRVAGDILPTPQVRQHRELIKLSISLAE